MNGKFNQHKYLVLAAKQSTHWLDRSKKQVTQLIIWWCVLWKTHVLGFFDGNETGESYVTMLIEKLMAQLERLGDHPTK